MKEKKGEGVQAIPGSSYSKPAMMAAGPSPDDQFVAVIAITVTALWTHLWVFPDPEP